MIHEEKIHSFCQGINYKSKANKLIIQPLIYCYWLFIIIMQDLALTPNICLLTDRSLFCNYLLE